MADPFTWGAIGLASSVAGGVTGGIGSIIGGDAKASMYRYQAGIADMNARLQEQNASYTLYAGDRNTAQTGLKYQSQIGKTQAAQAASNLDLNYGTSRDVANSARSIAQMDQTTIQDEATRRAYGYKYEAAKDRAQAETYRTSARNEQTAGYLGALGSFLGTASSVSSKWMQGWQTGVFGSRSYGYSQSTPSLMGLY